MKDLILIAFKFPPYAGVGGYRWSKISKYLAKQGHKIHVITVNWKELGPNTLSEDVSHENIIIYRIKSGNFHNFRYKLYKNKYINYIKSSIFHYLDKFIYFDDEAQLWGKYLQPYCKKLLKKTESKLIIATGHPFQANRWAAEIKKRNKSIKLIQDFRDPWIHPFKSMYTKEKIEKIEQWIKFSVENADHCVFVTSGLANYMLKGKKIPFSIISNGHDIDRKRELKPKKQWIFAGNLSNGRDELANIFLATLLSKPNLLKDNIVKFYGHIPKELIKKYEELFKKGQLNYCGIASQKEIINELAKSKVALHFNSMEFPYLVSTKIYEYAASGIPTLAITGGGEIDSLIKDNNWGVVAKPEKHDIEKAIRAVNDFEFKITRESVDKFHYRNLALRYSNIINQ